MREEDFPAFSALIKAVAEYYGKPITSPDLITIYWNGLRDLNLAELRLALNLHLQNPDSGQFMPKIADIRRMIDGGTQDAAMLAWAKVDRAVRQIGVYVDIVFDDPLIHAVLYEMGGWAKFATTKESDWPHIEREFVSRYRFHKTRMAIPEYPSVLRGISNTENLAKGLPEEPPRFFGDTATCERVRQGGTSVARIGAIHIAPRIGNIAERRLEINIGTDEKQLALQYESV